MKPKPTPAVAPPAQTSAPAAAQPDPQVGGRFERLPDGSLRPLDEPATPATPAAATPSESE